MRLREYAGNGAVLVVDDDPGTIRLLAVVLRPIAGVFAVTTAEEALSFIQTTPPDLILLDAGLPGMDGYQLCRELQNDPVAEEIPVIFLTADTSSGAETCAFAAGAADFIAKPVNPPVLEARVNLHLELKSRGDKLKALSRIDGLTGVDNRRVFDEVMAQEWRRAMRRGAAMSLLLIDIDHFKQYNDSYGHLAGDACLRTVAAGIQASVQRAGDVVARYGGEEFAVILPNSDASQAWALAERICADMDRRALPHVASDVAPHITVSIGAGTVTFGCPDGRPDTETCPDCQSFSECKSRFDRLIVLADKALYEAKYRGRAQVAAKVERLELDGPGASVPVSQIRLA